MLSYQLFACAAGCLCVMSSNWGLCLQVFFECEGLVTLTVNWRNFNQTDYKYRSQSLHPALDSYLYIRDLQRPWKNHVRVLSRFLPSADRIQCKEDKARAIRPQRYITASISCQEQTWELEVRDHIERNLQPDTAVERKSLCLRVQRPCGGEEWAAMVLSVADSGRPLIWHARLKVTQTRCVFPANVLEKKRRGTVLLWKITDQSLQRK